jgi:hypothetical protein
MIKIKITELSGGSVRIERYDLGAPSIHCYSAEFKADSNNIEDTVTVSRKVSPFTAFTVKPEEIEINGIVPATAEEAAARLNTFIGNFNTVGWPILMTLKEIIQGIVKEIKRRLREVEESLTWS